VRFASDDATFRMPAARLGLGYAYPGIRRFMNVLGAANTMDIFFSARKFDAAEALRMGFVGRVVRAAELQETVRTLASLIAENAPLTATAVKRTVNAYLRDPTDKHAPDAQEAIDRCNTSEDYREGVLAFAEKRRPIFVRR
jgi:enoyl-CoA hydratase/carnithine racemase